MQKVKVINITMLRALLFVLLCAVVLTLFVPSATAHAANAKVSSVLADMKKDPTFDVTKYPVRDNDYSLNVIQIAECEDNSLCVYVYQPEGKRRLATTINISQDIAEDQNEDAEEHTTVDVNSKKYVNYVLEIVSSEDTLYKYKVINFPLRPADELRYYDISSIYRKFDSKIDDPPEDSSLTISEVAYRVGQLWSATTVNNVVYYSMDYIDVIEVVEKYCGTVHYNKSSISPFEKACDSHFVAFSTDMPIDKLLSADVYFMRQVETKRDMIVGDISKPSYEISDPEEMTVTVTYDEEVKYVTGVWYKTKYDWTRIQTVDAFIKKEQLSDAAKKKLENTEWVLRFYESEYSPGFEAWDGAGTRTRETVSDVTILRLEFKLEGEVYNLGVVDNKTTGTDVWKSNQEPEQEMPTWVIWVIVILALIVAGFILRLISPFFPIIWAVLKKTVHVLWLIISAPFRAIVALVRKIRGKS